MNNQSNAAMLLRELDETRAMLASSRQERDNIERERNRLALHLLNLDLAISRAILPDDLRTICKRVMESNR